MFLVIGGLLVISGMVLNALLSGDVEAQEGVKDVEFGYIICKGLRIRDGYKERGYFGVNAVGGAILQIYGDGGKSRVAHLGRNTENGEMMFLLKSKSKTDKRMAGMAVGERGGRFESHNKMGENVVRIGVADDGGGTLDVRDKFGYKR